jgi:hypothetical protein
MVVCAFFVHVGIGYTWEPQFDANGNRHLILAIPSLAVLAVNIWHWFNQFVLQEMVYQVTTNKITPTSVPTGKIIPAMVDATGQMVVPLVTSKADTSK